MIRSSLLTRKKNNEPKMYAIHAHKSTNSKIVEHFRRKPEIGDETIGRRGSWVEGVSKLKRQLQYN